MIYIMIFMCFSFMMTSVILLPYVRLELETYLLKVLYRLLWEAEKKIHIRVLSYCF